MAARSTGALFAGGTVGPVLGAGLVAALSLRRHWRRLWWLPSLLWFQVLMYLCPAGAGPAKDSPDQTRGGIESASSGGLVAPRDG